ncbi:MAG TPA: B12-binding domain-containing protein [Pyrinomonadaceae bacterium]|nr:B12-binding domain-containing protein [Pyrinomonadaceae bacterium]
MKQTVPGYLTTRQLARLWRVSEATIKRWADAGHLNFIRTVGGHRRFTHEEVARFQNERGLAATGTTPLRLLQASAKQTRAAGADGQGEDGFRADGASLFFAAVMSCDERAATALLVEAYLDGQPLAEIFDEVVSPAMRRVGEFWRCGDLTVADEHLATRAAIRAVETLGISVKRRYAGAGVALCCGIEMELHSLAVVGLQVVLEGAGWRTYNLGGNTPFFALTHATARLRPALVCVSSTINTDIERAAREYALFQEAARAAGSRVVLGGEGFCEEGVRRRFPADLHADTFRQLLEFLPG